VSVRKTKDIKTGLLAKGFEQEITHHEMYWLYVRGRRTSIRTRISHGAAEYNDKLLGLMAKQLKLRRSEFDDLIECPLSGEDYTKLLAERGHVQQ
jgi:hypothetical protein